MDNPQIVILDGAAANAAIDELADVLVDCVEGGASVSFMLPFGRDDAKEFFQRVIASVARGETVLVAARLDGRIVGSVQLGLDMPPNQPHRGDIKKLLVHRAARNHGLGAALMARAEAEAKARGRTLLVLDTAGSEAERLYGRTGWQRVGVVPDYAMWPDGGFCDTVFFGRRFDHSYPSPLAGRVVAEGDRVGWLSPRSPTRPLATLASTLPLRGRDYAALTCPASQPSIARLRVRPQ
jgi:GNAT superfamily N-acetyltransferase